MKSKPKQTSKLLSPAGEKLRDTLCWIYAPIQCPSDEAEETPLPTSV
jgi:hypothetical protein